MMFEEHTERRIFDHRGLHIQVPTKEGNKMNRITVAYNDFMVRLFGEVPADPRSLSIDRATYAAAMHDVQAEHGLEQGDPDFLEWVLTLVGRSPVLTSEGANTHEQH